MMMKKSVLLILILMFVLNAIAQNSNKPNTNVKENAIIHADEIISAAKKVMVLLLQTLCLE